MCIEDRTTKALGQQVMDRLQSLEFCIVGCGGTGAGFAEMLVRTGATRLTLIDGNTVKASDLNRITAFCRRDVGRPKVCALEDRLQDIRNDLEVTTLHDSFREASQIAGDYDKGQRVRDAVHDADVVFIGTDSNSSRLAIERLIQCRPSDRPVMFLSCGIHVDRTLGLYRFECSWSPETPEQTAGDAGYGPENASYAAIVLEATAVSFSMLLSHIMSDESKFWSYSRRYDATLVPVETCVEGKSSNNK